MHLIIPDYSGGSIVNLMSTLARKYRGKTPYPELRALRSRNIRTKKVVLLLIDGLGYEWLLRHGKKSFLARNLRASMTSVFPPTTGAAMTSYYCGVAPQQHGFTGWFIYFRELGMVTAPLMARARGARASIEKADYSRLIPEYSFFTRIKTKGAAVYPAMYGTSPYNAHVNERCVPFTYKEQTITSFLRAATRANKRHAYVSAYWPWYDDSCHAKGTQCKEVLRQFRELDRKIERFAQRLKDTTLIVAADHGIVDVRHKIWLHDHPGLAKTLAIPLSGDFRTVYCYVKPGMEKQFGRYVKTKLSRYCALYKSTDLVKKGMFGNGKAAPQLLERIGTYTLLFKLDYGLFDQLMGEHPSDNIGYHGGMTREEMLVPLIVIKRT